MNLSYADAARVILRNSWHAMAHYRPNGYVFTQPPRQRQNLQF